MFWCSSAFAHGANVGRPGRGGTTTAVDLDGSAAERFALVVRKAVGGTLSSALEKVKGAA